MKVLIVGGGVAGVTAAKNLAESGGSFDLRIVGDEAYTYYYRPKLPDYLAGRLDKQGIQAYDESWYKQRQIRYDRDQRVLSIDPIKRTATLSNGSVEEYDRLILANGSRPFIPPIPGSQSRGVFALRSIADADSIMEYAASLKPLQAVVVGGGLLGLETAAALSGVGMEVTVLETAERLLPRQLDAEGAGVLTQKIAEMGIKVITGARVKAFASDPISSVVLDSSPELPAGLVVVSAGIVPNTALASSAGIEVGKGVIVDDFMRTSADGVYAVGDVAEHRGRVYGLVTACIDQAKTAAAHITAPDSALPYGGTLVQTSLKVAGIDLTSIGVIDGFEGDVTAVSEKTADAFKKIFVQGGRIVGAIFIGTRAGAVAISRLINQKKDISDVLSRVGSGILNDSFDLKSLLA